MLSERVQSWRERGRMLELAGLEVFVLDHQPEADEVVVFFHGFPSSSYDWRTVVPHLGPRRRLVFFDFPGFGLSEKPDWYSYSLHEQADIALMVLRELGVTRAHLVAHDMGTSVACELLARRERGLLGLELESLALMNGSVHIELARLTPSQRLLRSSLGRTFAKLGSWRIFRFQLRRILGRPVDDAELQEMWAQLRHRGGKELLPRTIYYIKERWHFWRRWIGALTRLDLPALVLWGPEDPVAVFAIAERLAGEIPGARLERLEGLGHYPQLEDPERVAAALTAWFDEVTARRHQP